MRRRHKWNADFDQFEHKPGHKEYTQVEDAPGCPYPPGRHVNEAWSDICFDERIKQLAAVKIPYVHTWKYDDTDWCRVCCVRPPYGNWMCFRCYQRQRNGLANVAKYTP